MGKILAAYVLPHPPIIIPGIGNGREEDANATIRACEEVAREVKSLKPETVIVITPHGPAFEDALCITVSDELEGDFRNFGHKDISIGIECDTILVEKIVSKAAKHNFPLQEITNSVASRFGINTMLDHGALVPLYFINQEYQNFKLVHISMGFLEDARLQEFGRYIKEAVVETDTNCVLVASGDLSHKLTADGPYGYNKNGKVFDERFVEIIRDGKLEELVKMDECVVEESAQCGMRVFITMAAIIDGERIKTEVLSYEGPFGIGYCVGKINL